MFLSYMSYTYMSCVVSYVVVGGCVSLRLLCRCVVYIAVSSMSFVSMCRLCRHLCCGVGCGVGVCYYVCKLQSTQTHHQKQQHEATKIKFLRFFGGCSICQLA